MRNLALCALGAVILQGVLGGLTVIYLLPAPISIGHAGLAQLFFCLTISLALFTSRGWRQPSRPAVDDHALRTRLTILSALIYTQIILGATMRHLGAGLAIPDFPLALGRLVPPVWTTPIAIHFAHRMGAIVVAAAAVTIAVFVWRRHGDRPEFSRPVSLLLAGIAAQITLGALVVLTRRDPIVNTTHVAGFVDRVATQWAGPYGRVVRRKLILAASIYAGDTITARRSITAKRRDGDRWLIEMHVDVVNQNGEVCCPADVTLDVSKAVRTTRR